MKKYPIICPSCQGNKTILNPNKFSSAAPFVICPACNGTGVVICEEEQNEKI